MNAGSTIWAESPAARRRCRGRDPRVDQQLLVVRHDVEHRLARPDDAALGAKAELDHGAGDRRRDQRARKHVPADREPLLDLGELGLGAAQLLIDGIQRRGALGDDLQLGLADRLLRPGDPGAPLGAGALDLAARAAEREQAGLALEPLAVELLGAFDLLVDQRDLPAVGRIWASRPAISSRSCAIRWPRMPRRSASAWARVANSWRCATIA